jgi:hypothetical protein
LVRRLWLYVALGALIALSAVAIACGDDDDDDGGGSEADREAILEIANALASTNGETATQEEIDFYLEHITDSFVQDFGTESVEVCAEDAPSCIGEPLTNVVIDDETVEVDGDSGRAVISADEGSFGIDLIKEDDVWKAEGLFVPDDDIPEGVEVVEMSLEEFAFDFDADALSGGDFALHVTNEGEQPHEVILAPLPEEGTLEDLLQDESFEPLPVFVKFPYESGDESDVALPAPLEAGRYAFVCFLPDTDDPEMTPHAFKGMAAEFTVE